ncbi:MAG: hypothetical protein ACREIC_19640, partial [Limisphaerales bacterium]
YNNWNDNNQTLASLNDDYSHLRDLNNQNPHPGAGQIDNDKTAREQRGQLLGFVKKTRAYFEPITPIPDESKVTDRDFSVALSQTIALLQREATNASVIVPKNYSFSFEAQKAKVSFAAGSLGSLAVQLGEVSNICNILFDAKVNSLDNIRREHVSNDDSSGPQTDYLSEKSVTNELAVLTPYEVTFRCFSAELAAVLSGFAGSPYGIVVKTMNVDLAPAPPASETPQPVVTTTYVYAQPNAAMQNNPAADAALAQQRMMSRYGLSGRGGEGGGLGGGIGYRPLGSQVAPAYAPPTAPMAGAAAGSKGGLQTVLDEKQLKVTLNLILFKLLPEKSIAAK